MLILEKPWLSLVLCLCIAIPICIGINLLLDVPSWANVLVGASSGLLAIKFTEMVYASRKKKGAELPTSSPQEQQYSPIKYKKYEIVPMPIADDGTQRFMIMDGWDYIQVPWFGSQDEAIQYIEAIQHIDKNK